MVIINILLMKEMHWAILSKFNYYNIGIFIIFTHFRFPQANVVARMTTERNARYYKMDHPKRGLAIIFNHELFKVSGLKQRTGTHVDCANFKQQLERLNFQVVVYTDLEHQDVIGKIREGKYPLLLMIKDN